MRVRNTGLERDEYQAWLLLCAALKESSAVTQEDLDSPSNARDSKGQQLFQVIREWGRAFAALAIESDSAR